MAKTPKDDEPKELTPKWQIVASVLAVLCAAGISWGANSYFLPRETHELEIRRLEQMIMDVRGETEQRQSASDKNTTLQLVDFRLDYLRIKIDYLAKLKIDQGNKFPSSYNLDLDASIKEYNDRLAEKQKLSRNN